MPEHHEPIEVIAGEPWDIPGTLLDPNRAPIDLTGATLERVLVDSCGNPCNRGRGRVRRQGLARSEIPDTICQLASRIGQRLAQGRRERGNRNARAPAPPPLPPPAYLAIAAHGVDFQH
jgi:hypothetical protein